MTSVYSFEQRQTCILPLCLASIGDCVFLCIITVQGRYLCLSDSTCAVHWSSLDKQRNIKKELSSFWSNNMPQERCAGLKNGHPRSFTPREWRFPWLRTLKGGALTSESVCGVLFVSLLVLVSTCPLTGVSGFVSQALSTLGVRQFSFSLSCITRVSQCPVWSLLAFPSHSFQLVKKKIGYVVNCRN